MPKKIFIAAGIILLALIVYYGRYFVVNTEVNEEAPDLLNTGDEPGELLTTEVSGSFTDVDRIHKGEGRAILVKSGAGSVLRFEDFRVTNGPDLYVWLTKSDNPTSDIESLGDYIDLGRLKGNVGNQNYTITQNVDGYDTVVVWCRQFSQLFTYANLK